MPVLTERQIEYATGLRSKRIEYITYYKIKKLSSLISREFSKNYIMK